MSWMSPTRSRRQRARTRSPVRRREALSTSIACKRAESAPSSLMSAQANGRWKGCARFGAVIQVQETTLPASATRANSESGSPLAGSYSGGGTSSRPSELRPAQISPSRRPVKKRPSTGPTLRLYGYSRMCGALSRPWLCIAETMARSGHRRAGGVRGPGVELLAPAPEERDRTVPVTQDGPRHEDLVLPDRLIFAHLLLNVCNERPTYPSRHVVMAHLLHGEREAYVDILCINRSHRGHEQRLDDPGKARQREAKAVGDRCDLPVDRAAGRPHLAVGHDAENRAIHLGL